MIKRAILGAAVVTLLAGFFFGRDVFSYATTTVGWVKGSVKDNVPIEFEIERARKMVKNLVPDIRKNMHTIAKEEVELERLNRQIVDLEGSLNKDKSAVLKLKDDLKAGGETFQYASHRYSRDDVKDDLSRRFERYKTNEATLASLREIGDARGRGLEAARQKLENMLAQRRQLEVEVQNVEARLKMVEARQAGCDYSFDDSRLGRVKELLADLQTKLEVSERMIGAEGHLAGEIELATPTPENIVDQVVEYFTDAAGTHVASQSDN